VPLSIRNEVLYCCIHRTAEKKKQAISNCLCSTEEGKNIRSRLFCSMPAYYKIRFSGFNNSHTLGKNVFLDGISYIGLRRWWWWWWWHGREKKSFSQNILSV